ncbi:hypothetical protein SAMN04489729_6874 [Amycolatopsis lurida]|uniref:Uncharacterized protein n=1 Tax=Amycolatopsis lurida NRRL 2430 TaxID=1460371 RepID=A0A2P2FP15_AMYLU|nr:hypothetical protein [Amycolatopsis lurida]KFU78455.1 hypothetical protein BB31_25110 [Amycolatopsis lurida NRRL 2430]SEE26396.1 hypothetical protein SAMN04489729_6874 [Amycolatopsis lurida]
MTEYGGVQRYLYWSDRLVGKYLDDLGVRVMEKRQRKISTPNIRGFLPAVEWSEEGPAVTRPDLAAKLERGLGQSVVDTFASPPPVHFARGVGDVVFGEFVGTEPGRAVMYTTVSEPDGGRIAVCLFGSVHNYADFVADSGAPSQHGWTCSEAGSIRRFLDEECRVRPSWASEEELARDAVKVACSQGEDGAVPVARRRCGWHRGHTYGDTGEVGEWLAEIYCDFDFRKTQLGPQDGHDRVLIGAPFWLRTPSLRAIRLYADYAEGELDERERKASRRWGLRKLFGGASMDPSR